MTADVSSSLDRVGYCLMVAGFVLGGLAFVVSSTSAYVLYRSSSMAQTAFNERIALAQKKTAELELRAAELNQEAEQLKSELTWRRLTQEQGQKLISALAEHKELAIQVQGVDADPEASQYHQDIYSTLEASGVHASLYTGLERAVGMWIAGNNNAAVATVQNAFLAAGVELHRRPDHGFGAASEKVVIVVGSRPPLFFSSSRGPQAVNWYERGSARH